MNCAWQELLGILPNHIRQQLTPQDRNTVQEIRLRLDKPAELICGVNSRLLKAVVRRQDLAFVINTASQYSPWAAATSAMGFITAAGGHRIGICGECTVKDNRVVGIRTVTSLCIRVARDLSGIAPTADRLKGSVLILGPPGSGKTTLMRDLVRNISDQGPGSITVVDERGELFPANCGFSTGKRTDVLTGVSKPEGVSMALRTMGPKWIAVDEITQEDDCRALLQTGWCGVRLLATAHAKDIQDLRQRPIYKPLTQSDLFDTILILREDKTWKMERMHL